MSGIGKYSKGKRFELRSGNKPSGFKMMGSSPNKEATSVNNPSENIADSLNVPEVNKTKTIASKIGNSLIGAFTSGLDAVYGQGKVIPGNKVKFHDPKKKKEKEFGTTALDDNKTEKS